MSWALLPTPGRPRQCPRRSRTRTPQSASLCRWDSGEPGNLFGPGLPGSTPRHPRGQARPLFPISNRIWVPKKRAPALARRGRRSRGGTGGQRTAQRELRPLGPTGRPVETVIARHREGVQDAGREPADGVRRLSPVLDVNEYQRFEPLFLPQFRSHSLEILKRNPARPLMPGVGHGGPIQHHFTGRLAITGRNIRRRRQASLGRCARRVNDCEQSAQQRQNQNHSYFYSHRPAHPRSRRRAGRGTSCTPRPAHHAKLALA